MTQRWFHSKIMIFSVIFTLLLMTSATALPSSEGGKGHAEKGPVIKVKYGGKGVTSAQEKNFTLLLEDGKRLLKEWMDYAAAIDKFKEAEKLATQNRQKSDVYYYLSLAYFASLEERGVKDFTDTIEKLIEVDYYRQLDENECPPQFIAMYTDVKRGYGVLKVLSVPPGADVFFNDSKASEGKTPLTVGYTAGEVKVRVKKGGKQKKDTLTVLAGQETSSPVYSLEGRSSLIYIVGGVLVAGAAGAVLLLAGGGEEEALPTTGNLTINSSPTGAKIYMGKISAEDTSQVTPYTFSDIAPGNYIVVLKLENYADYNETAAVTAGQTATVNPSLSQHTIAVTKPAAGDKISLVDKTTIEIKWTLDGGTQALAVQRAKIPADFASLNRDVIMRSRIRARSQNTSSSIRSRRSARGNTLSREAIAVHAQKVVQPGQPANRANSSLSQRLRVTDPGQVASGRNDSTAGRFDTMGNADSAYISNFKIFLLSGPPDFKTREEIAADIPGTTRTYKWKVHKSDVDLTVDTYKLEVQSQSDPNVSSSSGEFDVYEPSAVYEFKKVIDIAQHNIYNPFGLVIGNNGIYVTDEGKDPRTGNYLGQQRIVKLSMTGNSIVAQKLIPSGHPYAADMDINGNIYVAEEGNNRIAKYDKNLSGFMQEWKAGGAGSIKPRGVSVDAELNVFVNDVTNKSKRVVKFNKNGNMVTEVWSPKGFTPIHVHVDNANNILYIADRDKQMVHRYSSQGNCSRIDAWTFSGDAMPVDVDVDSRGNVLVLCGSKSGKYTDQKVYIMSQSGVEIGKFSFAGTDKTALAHPNAIAIDRNAGDTVYIIDANPDVRQIKVWKRKK